MPKRRVVRTSIATEYRTSINVLSCRDPLVLKGVTTSVSSPPTMARLAVESR